MLFFPQESFRIRICAAEGQADCKGAVSVQDNGRCPALAADDFIRHGKRYIVFVC